ncbi:MAG: hypothetical protein ACE5LB_12715 [Acidiferrobacterales bacterium]
MTSILRIFAILRKEIRQLRRDRLTMGMIVGIPAIQITLFGYAINTDVRHLRAAAADQANTQLSRTLLADTEASQVVDIARRARTPEELEALLRRGEISVGIFVPRDFERRIQQHGRGHHSGKPGAVQWAPPDPGHAKAEVDGLPAAAGPQRDPDALRLHRAARLPGDTPRPPPRARCRRRA